MEQNKLTVWPDAVMPIPDVSTTEWVVVSGSIAPADPDALFKGATLPEEFYLRQLMKLDLDSIEAIAAFCSAYGTLGFDGLKGSAESFRQVAREARDMTRILTAYLSHREWYDQGLEADPSDRVNSSLNTHVSWLARKMNTGLKDYGPVVMTGDFPDDIPYRFQMPLFTAICAQMFNALVETPHLRWCKLDGCNQLFEYQQGRSELGGHRADADYCSRECARAAVNRELRKRKRDAIRLHQEEGLTPEQIVERFGTKTKASDITRWIENARTRKGGETDG